MSWWVHPHQTNTPCPSARPDRVRGVNCSVRLIFAPSDVLTQVLQSLDHIGKMPHDRFALVSCLQAHRVSDERGRFCSRSSWHRRHELDEADYELIGHCAFPLQIALKQRYADHGQNPDTKKAPQPLGQGQKVIVPRISYRSVTVETAASCCERHRFPTG